MSNARDVERDEVLTGVILDVSGMSSSTGTAEVICGSAEEGDSLLSPDVVIFAPNLHFGIDVTILFLAQIQLVLSVWKHKINFSEGAELYGVDEAKFAKCVIFAW